VCGELLIFHRNQQFATHRHLSQILRGKRSPSLTTIVKLAPALDVQVADFFQKS